MRDKIEALGMGLEDMAVWVFAIAAVLAALFSFGALAAYLCVLMGAVFTAEQIIEWREDRPATEQDEPEGEAA